MVQADWFDPKINPKLEEFARFYGTVILPTKTAIPRHKGKVEAGVKFAQNNAVKGRSFESLAAQNLFLSDWERTVADTSIHGTTRPQVAKLFDEIERAALQPLPAGLFRYSRKLAELSIDDGLVRDFMKDEAFKQQDRTLRRYLKPELVIIDDMGLKALPKQSGEYLLEVVMRRYEIPLTAAEQTLEHRHFYV